MMANKSSWLIVLGAVTVGTDKVRAEYVRSWLPTAETSTRKNAQMDHSWEVYVP